MRKITFTLLTLFSGYVAANAQLTNGDLETWTSNQWSTAPGGSGNTYEEPGSGTNRDLHFLRGLNELNDLPGLLNIPKSCFKTDTAHGGNFAARVRSQIFGPYFIPGFLGTGDIDINAQTLHLGRPYTSRPNSFKGWYKYFPANDDSAKFQVYFTKYDALNQVSNIIGAGSSTVTVASPAWKSVEFNITWTDPGNPDTIVFIAAASGGYNLANFLSSAGDAGSQLIVDDMTLEAGFAGTDEEYINENVSIYPNPSADFINIATGNLPANLKLFVYDMNGKQVMAQNINGNNNMIDISALPQGVYGVVIQDNFRLLHRSRIVKK